MTEKDERSIVSGEPRYGKQDPTWLDHLGDRKPEAVERASEPDKDDEVIGIAPEDPELVQTRVSFLLNWFGGCALVAATSGLSLLHPPVWLAAIFAAGIAYGLLRFSEGLVAAHNRAWELVHDGEA